MSDTPQRSSIPSREVAMLILDSIGDGVFTVDKDWKITWFNKAAEEITGVPRDQALGRSCRDVLRADSCEQGCLLRHTVQTRERTVNKGVAIVDARGQKRSISISTSVLLDENGCIAGGVETFRDLTVLEELRKCVEKGHAYQDMVSCSHRMWDLFSILPSVAESPSTVLIEGETGTGKELLARAIHALSPRRGKPFVAVNCGALPDTLLEAELFGYKAGAFTDARKDKPGRFKLAEGGSIFLDEIGDVSPALQVRLLRVLEERTYEPLGAVESERADVRVIAATNKKLAELVQQGRFRQDLYYRVNVVRLELPPLRERLEDVPLLVDAFIARFNALQRKQISGIEDEALARLMAHDYPGNIRELQNIVERAFVLCRSGPIRLRHLPEHLRRTTAADPAAGTREATSLHQVEAAFLLNALRRNEWNRLRTAADLGVHKSTLYRRIKTLGLELPPRHSRQS